MGFYVLSGLETDKKLKEISKRYLLTDIAKRRECIKALSISGGINNIKNCTLFYYPTLQILPETGVLNIIFFSYFRG